MNNVFFDRLRDSGAALGSLALGRLLPALEGRLAAALSLDRATRDRLLIFDPASAPLVRGLIAATDLRPWCAAAANRWIVAVPAARAGDLEVRHPALFRQLAAMPAPEGSGEVAAPWWALPADLAVAPASPRIIVGAGGAPCAWDATAALVGGEATVIAAAEPYWLALLGSSLGRELRVRLSLAEFPVPPAPGPTRASLEGLAVAASDLAAQIDGLERAVLVRLVSDFGPPGVRPGPVLSRWWTLDFDELAAAVGDELRNPIPARFQPTWAEIHGQQRAAHAEAQRRLDELQAAIDRQVAALYDGG
jgi:hypothetical protein